MPAVMDDPASPTIYRVSGEAPYPAPNSPLPADILPRQVTLRDRQTVATVVPFASREQVPLSLLLYLSDQFAKEIEKGDTYAMVDPLPFERFASYWFQNFGAIMLLGSIEKPEDVDADKDWSKECLGSFYIKPNYPGRSSHVCNAGFLVTDASRNRGVGRLMGESYLDWAPKLGYKYSVFNLVYETNVASCKIWDALGFKRIGRVPGGGNLKSYPGRLVDILIYGRDLSLSEESDELVSEERFEKIKFYLKHGKYPNGADRAEKSRLRSAATHYKLLEGDVLMLKDKEVISDTARQYDIARQVHALQHAGINKTTATIAERYHWRGIKDTVSDVIRQCTECEDGAKSSSNLFKPPTPNPIAVPSESTPPVPAVPSTSSISALPAATIDTSLDQHHSHQPSAMSYAVHTVGQHPPTATGTSQDTHPNVSDLPVTPYSPDSSSGRLLVNADHAYQPIDPQILHQPYPNPPPPPAPYTYHSVGHDQYHNSELELEANALQQLLSAGSHDDDGGGSGTSDRDVEMMLAQQLENNTDHGRTTMDLDGPGDGLVDPQLDHAHHAKVEMGAVTGDNEHDGRAKHEVR